MKVGIDLTALLPLSTGVDNYLKSLVRSLARLDSDNSYYVFVNFEDRALLAADGAGSAHSALPPNFRVLPLSLRPRPTRLGFQQLVQPALLRALDLDLLHSPSFIMPMYRARRRHVLTIHDMTSFSHPDTHPPFRRSRLYKAAVFSSIRRADRVSVPSASVREDILGWLPEVAPDRVRVIPGGVHERFGPRDEGDVAPALERLGVRRPYILHVGAIDPRKNLARLVRSFRELIASGKFGGDLVLAGPPSWWGDGVSEKLEASDLGERVRHLGYVQDADLPYLYAGASLLVYPSLREGFGFPPLEAMACGTPVVASSCPALLENLEGCAELVPPEDVGSLTAALARLLRDDALRAGYIREGLVRSAGFRWDDFARRTLDLYGELAPDARR